MEQDPYGVWNVVLNVFQAVCLAIAVWQLWIGYGLLLEIHLLMKKDN
jgi:hypothetical protein